MLRNENPDGRCSEVETGGFDVERKQMKCNERRFNRILVERLGGVSNIYTNNNNDINIH